MCRVEIVTTREERYRAEDRANTQSDLRNMHERHWMSDLTGEMEGNIRHASPVGRFARGSKREAK